MKDHNVHVNLDKHNNWKENLNGRLPNRATKFNRYIFQLFNP